MYPQLKAKPKDVTVIPHQLYSNVWMKKQLLGVRQSQAGVDPAVACDQPKHRRVENNVARLSSHTDRHAQGPPFFFLKDYILCYTITSSYDPKYSVITINMTSKQKSTLVWFSATESIHIQ